jgi:hypothetical protein
MSAPCLNPPGDWRPQGNCLHLPKAVLRIAQYWPAGLGRDHFTILVRLQARGVARLIRALKSGCVFGSPFYAFRFTIRSAPETPGGARREHVSASFSLSPRFVCTPYKHRHRASNDHRPTRVTGRNRMTNKPRSMIARLGKLGSSRARTQ